MAIRIGSRTSSHVKGEPKSAIMRKIIGNARMKFTMLDKTTAAGSSSRGKYTFLIRCPLPTMLFMDPETEEEHQFQGKIPQRMKTGNISVGLRRRTLKTR